MAKSSKKILGSFQARLKALEQIRSKQESLYANNQLARRDIEEVYGAIFLDAVVSFEALIEEVFVGLLAGQLKSTEPRFNTRVQIRSVIVARDAILRGKGYFNWLPYKNTEGLAKVFFTGGRPFTCLDNKDRNHVKKCLKTRDALAHQSQHARSKFRDTVLAGFNLTPRDRRPKSFLRAQFSANPPKTYFEQLVGELYSIASKLC